MKKKILVVALVVCVLVLSIASATMAYFTDTKTATNVFTVGDVKITLSETQYDADNNATTSVVSDSFTGYNYGKVYPGFTYDKYPTITNVGTEEAYLAAKITITNVNPTNTDANVTNVLATTATEGKVLVTDFLSTNVFADTANYVVNYVVTDTAIEVYVVYTKAAATNTAITLFDEVVIPATWDNTEMANLENMNIVVEAYAVQTAGMTDALSAMQAAFDTFDNVTVNP